MAWVAEGNDYAGHIDRGQQGDGDGCEIIKAQYQQKSKAKEYGYRASDEIAYQ